MSNRNQAKSAGKNFVLDLHLGMLELGFFPHRRFSLLRSYSFFHIRIIGISPSNSNSIIGRANDEITEFMERRLG